jgi:hypothetical protein
LCSNLVCPLPNTRLKLAAPFSVEAICL